MTKEEKIGTFYEKCEVQNFENGFRVECKSPKPVIKIQSTEN